MYVCYYILFVGLLVERVKELLNDATFSIPSNQSSCAHSMADHLLRGALDHNAKISVFENDLKTALMHCLQIWHLSEKIRQERVWSAYHQFRSSDAFKAQWNTFLKQIGCPCSSRIAIQYISNFIFKKITYITSSSRLYNTRY